MTEEEARDRDRDHDDGAQGEHRVVGEGRALTGILVARPVARRLFCHRPPHRRPDHPGLRLLHDLQGRPRCKVPAADCCPRPRMTRPASRPTGADISSGKRPPRSDPPEPASTPIVGVPLLTWRNSDDGNEQADRRQRSQRRGAQADPAAHQGNGRNHLDQTQQDGQVRRPEEGGPRRRSSRASAARRSDPPGDELSAGRRYPDGSKAAAGVRAAHCVARRQSLRRQGLLPRCGQSRSACGPPLEAAAADGRGKLPASPSAKAAFMDGAAIA